MNTQDQTDLVVQEHGDLPGAPDTRNAWFTPSELQRMAARLDRFGERINRALSTEHRLGYLAYVARQRLRAPAVERAIDNLYNTHEGGWWFTPEQLAAESRRVQRTMYPTQVVTDIVQARMDDEEAEHTARKRARKAEIDAWQQAHPVQFTMLVEKAKAAVAAQARAQTPMGRALATRHDYRKHYLVGMIEGLVLLEIGKELRAEIARLEQERLAVEAQMLQSEEAKLPAVAQAVA